jgi:hypothetical protein
MSNACTGTEAVRPSVTLRSTWARDKPRPRPAKGVTLPPPPAIFGVTDQALAQWIAVRTTLHPLATYTEPVPRCRAALSAVQRVYIHCTGNPTTTPDLFASSAEKVRASGWQVHELAAGHLAMLTAPRELAALLLDVVASGR